MADDGGKTEQVDCFWCGSVYELQDDMTAAQIVERTLTVEVCNEREHPESSEHGATHWLRLRDSRFNN
jgi:hypothetical protein